MYHLVFDRRRRLFTVTLEGFWTLATTAGFSAAFLAQGAAARVRYGRFAVFIDARRFPVQATEVSKALEAVAGKSFLVSDGPYASVVPTVLTKLQSERVLNRTNNRTFLCVDAAHAWMDEVWPSPVDA